MDASAPRLAGETPRPRPTARPAAELAEFGGPILRLRERASDKATLPVQPIPIGGLVQPTPDGRWTAIMRRWRGGESAWCRLCPRGECIALADSCLILAPGVVEDRDALLYSTVGVRRVARQD